MPAAACFPFRQFGGLVHDANVGAHEIRLNVWCPYCAHSAWLARCPCLPSASHGNRQITKPVQTYGKSYSAFTPTNYQRVGPHHTSGETTDVQACTTLISWFAGHVGSFGADPFAERNHQSNVSFFEHWFEHVLLQELGQSGADDRRWAQVQCIIWESRQKRTGCE